MHDNSTRKLTIHASDSPLHSDKTSGSKLSDTKSHTFSSSEPGSESWL